MIPHDGAPPWSRKLADQSIDLSVFMPEWQDDILATLSVDWWAILVQAWNSQGIPVQDSIANDSTHRLSQSSEEG